MNVSRLTESFALALETVRGHKLRSGLTILGVIVGTVTVMAVSAFIAGLDHKFAQEVEAFGTRSIWVYKFDPTFGGGRDEELRKRKPITYEDAMAIQESCPAVALVAPLIGPDNPVLRANSEEMYIQSCNGATPEYGRMNTVAIARGRFFTDSENDFRKSVAVIGADIATTFWPGLDPLGKTFLIDANEVEVVGVFEKKDNFFISGDDGGNPNRQVYIPYNTMLRFYGVGNPDMQSNWVVCEYREGMKAEAEEEIRSLLRQRRRVPFGQEDNFAVFSPDVITEKFHAITGGIAMLMFALSAVGLLIGGIGVMNIMLVSVTERTKEIGIRKAIGARRGDIVSQFLIEAATLTGLGGVLGILLGWLLSLVINLFLPSYVPLWAPIAGFTISVGLGVLFGMWPAMKASRLDPIDALRYE